MDNVIKMPSHSYDTTNRSAKPMEHGTFLLCSAMRASVLSPLNG